MNKDDCPSLEKILANQEAAIAMLIAQGRAFPKDRHGEPDYEGHYDHHAGLIDKAAVKQSITNEAVKKVVSSACVGIGGIIVYALWAYLKANV